MPNVDTAALAAFTSPLEDFFNEPSWTTTLTPSTKRPATQDLDLATPFYTASERASQSGTLPGYLSRSDSPYFILDIDQPKEEKARLKLLQKEVDAELYSHMAREALLALISALPDDLKKLMQLTYTEVTMSEAGLRMVVTCSELNKAAMKGKRVSSNLGELAYNGTFQIFTGKVTKSSPNRIAEVPASLLQKHWPKLRYNAGGVKEETAPVTPALTPIKGGKAGSGLRMVDEDAKKTRLHELVLGLPWDDSRKIVRAFEQVREDVPYSRYEYWVTVGMCLYDYGVRSGLSAEACLSFFEWSRMDPVTYSSDEDVEATWTSFREKQDSSDLSYKTLLNLIMLTRYQWPEPSQSNPKLPNRHSYLNFKYYLEYNNVEILYQRGRAQYFLRGDMDFITKWFGERNSAFPDLVGPFDSQGLATKFAIAMQQDGWGVIPLRAAMELVHTHLSGNSLDINLIRTWLDTPWDELSEMWTFERHINPGAEQCIGDLAKYNDNSNLDYLFDQFVLLDPSQRNLAKTLLYHWFCGFIKLQYSDDLLQLTNITRFDANAGMLLLIGPENSYKTTFFELLLPQPLARDHVVSLAAVKGSASDKALRDFRRYLTAPGFGVMNEFEGSHADFLNTDLKQLLTDDMVDYTEIYSKSPISAPRMMALGGTSNDHQQKLSRNGSRRLWILGVEHIHTENLIGFNWHYFYNNLKKEVMDAVQRGETPWMPSRATIAALEEQNTKRRTANSLHLAFEDSFHPFTPGDGYDVLMSLTNIQKKHINLHLNKDMRDLAASEVGGRLSTALMARELADLSLRFTGLIAGKKYELPKASGYYLSGKVYTGEGKTEKWRWFLPERVSPFEVEPEDVDNAEDMS